MILNFVFTFFLVDDDLVDDLFFKEKSCEFQANSYFFSFFF